ncbi:MAG: MerR family transcriptional regulator [Candidatus Accumulibacter sp.]|jgi:DNA-binding transcriptional MerR regulator|nr:MerR family transcriptional regulator [Accumulibacter sp.]
MERNPKETPEDSSSLLSARPREAPSKDPLPPIPAKRYFTIGEVSKLCGVKAHVLRYWEQEFSQLKPDKRRGNRRYYQHHEVILARRIRELLYGQGFTISGARNRLLEEASSEVEESGGSGSKAPMLESIRAELLDVLEILKTED